MIFTVAIPSPLRRLFDYLPPADRAEQPGGEGVIRPGTRVRVPFGRRSVVGLVVGHKSDSAQPRDKLKAIESVLDASPLLDASLLELALWAAHYYQHPVGEALFSTLPTLLRQGAGVPDGTEEHWQLSALGLGLGEQSLKQAKKQRELALYLMNSGPIPARDMIARGFRRTTFNALEAKELVIKADLPAATVAEAPLLRETPLALRQEQQRALSAIDLDRFGSYLLFGDTGTGKTEVYLQAIAEVVARGRQALVLVPEINLTPQTLERFGKRFACDIVALHSGLTDKERLDAWARARSGRASIIIGTRSAVFSPLAEPGIIILDEEHDPSFKQQEGFRYSARDVAVMRASKLDIPVVLGSATPALESLANVDRKRYQMLELREREQTATPPAWQLVDLKGTDLKDGFSRPLLSAMDRELEQGNQVLVFLNRRGYAPVMLCHDCGWQAECRHCSARLTAHLGRRRLICHHCEHQQPIPNLCPTCNSPRLHFAGQGTERSEEILRALFPQVPVLRIDRDTTRRKQALAQTIARIRENQPCILIGTQMVAKGHHFPGVSLAALLDVDGGLFSTDFRSMERTAQLITQVAGRAGRGEKPGKVLIQSHYVDHPLLSELVNGNYRSIARILLRERHQQQLPPFSNLALFRADAPAGQQAENYLKEVRQLCEAALPPSPQVSYLGPLPSALEKRKGFYRFTLQVNALDRRALSQAITAVCATLDRTRAPSRLKWTVDIDPQEML